MTVYAVIIMDEGFLEETVHCGPSKNHLHGFSWQADPERISRPVGQT